MALSGLKLGFWAAFLSASVLAPPAEFPEPFVSVRLPYILRHRDSAVFGTSRTATIATALILCAFRLGRLQSDSCDCFRKGLPAGNALGWMSASFHRSSRAIRCQ
jgi:hypothetical protein